MRTRTFIGLALLIIALIVASTPALLDPTSRGVELVAIKAGALPAPSGAGSGSKASSSAGATNPVAAQLELRGYARQKGGDLRDTEPLGARRYDERGRLAGGSGRVLLPNQTPGAGGDAPPNTTPKTVLLDITGCPVFRPETDIIALMADPAAKALYAAKAATSTDTTCGTRLTAQITAAAAAAAAAATPATGQASTRQLTTIDRGSRLSTIIALQEVDLLAQVMDTPTIDAAVTKLR